jgi:hypothetical protein
MRRTDGWRSAWISEEMMGRYILKAYIFNADAIRDVIQLILAGTTAAGIRLDGRDQTVTVTVFTHQETCFLCMN